MDQKIKIFVKKNRLLLSTAREIKKVLAAFRRPVSGKNNSIINNGSLRKVKYDVVGNNNMIEIGKGALLANTSIFIRGDNHHFILRENRRTWR